MILAQLGEGGGAGQYLIYAFFKANVTNNIQEGNPGIVNLRKFIDNEARTRQGQESPLMYKKGLVD